MCFRGNGCKRPFMTTAKGKKLHILLAVALIAFNIPLPALAIAAFGEPGKAVYALAFFGNPLYISFYLVRRVLRRGPEDGAARLSMWWAVKLFALLRLLAEALWFAAFFVPALELEAYFGFLVFFNIIFAIATALGVLLKYCSD